ncbi:hypothetical protein BDV32DRAFT_127957 [Aspergillus pseudonomiae]|nr:hypothetical protein BDV32DRAFT_127957 [Aspergillus pseudonomiae]
MAGLWLVHVRSPGLTAPQLRCGHLFACLLTSISDQSTWDSLLTVCFGTALLPFHSSLLRSLFDISPYHSPVVDLPFD